MKVDVKVRPVENYGNVLDFDVDMIAYYISPDDDEEHEIQVKYATCLASVKNATSAKKNKV